MKWTTNKTWLYKKQAKECWHRWFAWYPVAVTDHPDGAETRVWLIWIERKGVYYSSPYSCKWYYSYRTIEGVI